MQIIVKMLVNLGWYIMQYTVDLVILPTEIEIMHFKLVF